MMCRDPSLWFRLPRVVAEALILGGMMETLHIWSFAADAAAWARRRLRPTT